MFETAEKARALETAHVNGRVTEDFTWRAPERSGIEAVGQQIAILGHDRHHGREVDVEAEHAQHFPSDSAERARSGQIAVLTNRARRRHRGEDASQTIDEATFLIDAEQWRRRNDFANG